MALAARREFRPPSNARPPAAGDPASGSPVTAQTWKPGSLHAEKPRPGSVRRPDRSFDRSARSPAVPPPAPAVRQTEQTVPHPGGREETPASTPSCRRQPWPCRRKHRLGLPLQTPTDPSPCIAPHSEWIDCSVEVTADRMTLPPTWPLAGRDRPRQRRAAPALTAIFRSKSPCSWQMPNGAWFPPPPPGRAEVR